MTEQDLISVGPEQNAAVASLQIEPLSSLASGVAITLAARLLILGGSLGSSVIVGRWLGPEGLGALAVLNVTVALASQLGGAGLPSAATYFIAKDRSAFASAWANAIGFALTAGTLAAAVVVILAEVKPEIFGGVPPQLVVIVSISIPFQLLTLLGLNALLAIDRIKLMNVLDSVMSVLVLANTIAVLVIWRHKLGTLVGFNTGATIAVSLLVVWLVGRRAQESGRLRPDFNLLRRMLAYGLKFYVSIVAGVVIFRADLLIVNRFRGANEAGVYAVASQFSFLLLILPAVIGSLLFPRVASRQHRAAAEYTVEVTRHTSFVMVIVCLGAAAASFALPLVYGHRFADATVQLLILLPGMFFVSIESVLVQHFNGTRLPAAIPGFWIVTMIVNLGLNLALVPAWGARAAAANSSLSYALIFILVTSYFCRKTGYRPVQIFLLQKNEFRDLFARFRGRVFAG